MNDRAQARGRQKRQLKNLLIDRKFQLKYAGFLVAIAAVLSLILGAVLYRTSQSLVDQSNDAVQQGQKAVALGKEVAKESQKVSAVVKMNIVKDPVYADNPELLEAFQEESKDEEQKQLAQQKALEDQAATLSTQSQQIVVQQQKILTSLFALLGLLVFGLGLAAIVVTHKVAGPVFKMTRQFHDLGGGNWKLPAPLRKGDELVAFHGAFSKMVEQLRQQRELEIDQLDAAVEELSKKIEADDMVNLLELREDMSKVLAR